MLDSFFDSMERSFTAWLAEQIMHMTSWLTSILLTSPTWFLTTDGFAKVHNLMVTLSLLGMVPVIGWLGINLLTGKSTVQEALSALGRALLAPVLMWSAPQFMLLVAGIFDRLTTAVIGASTGPSLDDALDTVGMQVGLIVFIAIYAYTIVRLILFYAYRNYALLALVAMSPLAFLLWVFPQHADKADRWAREATLLLTTQLAHAIQLTLLSALTIHAGSPGAALAGKASFLLLQIGAMQFMLKTPDWLREFIHPMPRESVEGPLRRRAARWKKQNADPVALAKKLLAHWRLGK